LLGDGLAHELKRLLPNRPPIAIAFSGGGDSTALLHALRDRAAVALIVDHCITPGSAERTALAESRALAMGVRSIVLKPKSSPLKTSQSAARALRYTLMGEACRNLGIANLLTAHTMDDIAELAVMRAARNPSDYGTMPALSHAPVWPGLYGIDIVRPLRLWRRSVLRDYLKTHTLRWIDDPANADSNYERVRVRRSCPIITQDDIQKEDVARRRCAKSIATDSKRLRFQEGWVEAPINLSPDTLELASRCASGAKHRGLSEPKTATGGGAHILRRGNTLLLTSDPGAVFGRDGVAALSPIALSPRNDTLWGERFVIAAHSSDLHVEPLGTRWPEGHPKPHITVRRTLPGVFRSDRLIAIPGWGEVSIRYLAEERFKRTLASTLRPVNEITVT